MDGLDDDDARFLRHDVHAGQSSACSAHLVRVPLPRSQSDSFWICRTCVRMKQAVRSLLVVNKFDDADGHACSFLVASVSCRSARTNSTS
jgi:hypothetical protein